MAPTASSTLEPTVHNPDLLYYVRTTLTIRGMNSVSKFDSAYGDLQQMLSVVSGVQAQRLSYEDSEMVMAIFGVFSANGQKKLEETILDEDFFSDLNDYIISADLRSLMDMMVMTTSTPESFTEPRKETTDDSDDKMRLLLIKMGVGFLPLLIILALVLSYPKQFDCTKHADSNGHSSKAQEIGGSKLEKTIEI